MDFIGNKEYHDSQISINCGGCAKSKGCEIKKEFKSIVLKYKKLDYCAPVFKLKCPLKTSKFQGNNKIKFTVAYGAHRITNLWDCDWGNPYYGDPCDNCINDKICKDGIVKFKLKKYKGNIEFNGIILNESKNKTYVIKVDINEFNSKKAVFNRYDLLKLKSIRDKIKEDGFWDGVNHKNADMFYFVSKEKFIKPFNLD